jgi:hypothetical protein
MLVAGSKVQSRRRVDRESRSRCGLGPAGALGKATRLPVPTDSLANAKPPDWATSSLDVGDCQRLQHELVGLPLGSLSATGRDNAAQACCDPGYARAVNPVAAR